MMPQGESQSSPAVYAVFDWLSRKPFILDPRGKGCLPNLIGLL
jgi:hypothetical protein